MPPQGSPVKSLSGICASGELSHTAARRLHSSSVSAWLSSRLARLISNLPNAGIAARSASVSASPWVTVKPQVRCVIDNSRSCPRLLALA